MMSLKLILLMGAIVLTGMSSGLCFNWSNTIVPGISKLNDPAFLQAFQEMNRVIINPTFLLVFFGPVLLHTGTILFFRNVPINFKLMIVTAGLIYFFGLVVVTIFGNVPINEILENTDLTMATSEEMKSLRETLEIKWARLHLVRTVSAIIAFILLVGASLLNYKSLIF